MDVLGGCIWLLLYHFGRAKNVALQMVMLVRPILAAPGGELLGLLFNREHELYSKGVKVDKKDR
jgi:hypothetical protein